MLRRTFVDCSIGNFAERLRLQVSRRFAGFRNEFEIGSPGPTTDCDRRARGLHAPTSALRNLTTRISSSFVSVGETLKIWEVNAE
jgi:hypothetical protein